MGRNFSIFAFSGPPGQETRGKKLKAKPVIGIVIIAIFAVWGISSFMSTTIKYVPLAEVSQSQGNIQVMGKIDFDAVEYDTENSRIIFELIDLEDQSSTRRLKVIYSGIVPGNFEQATSVVARGYYEGGALQADQLLVKCPSKYQGLDGET
jgi:cytochrome c-type biogenesis protein CcmE